MTGRFGKLLLVVVSFVFSSLCQSEDSAIGHKDNKTSMEVQKLKNFEYKMKDMGFEDTIIKSFNYGESDSFAMTVLVESRDKGEMVHYSANILNYAGTVILYFNVYDGCAPFDGSFERIITVNNQRVRSIYACDYSPGESAPHAVYRISTDAGKLFVENEFLNNGYVFIKFDDVEIPFSTEGFQHAWREASQPAL